MMKAMTFWQRQFHERLLGGVCGALAARAFGPAWLWRTLFVVLCPLTLGAAAFLYLALWYGLPRAQPMPTLPRAQRRPLLVWLRVALAGLAALACVLLWRLGGWPPGNAALLALAIFGLLLCLSELRPQSALALPLLSLLALWLLLLGQSGVLPSGWVDLLARAAPAALLFLGLRSLFLGKSPGRARTLWAHVAALAGASALTAALALLAIAQLDAQPGGSAAERLRFSSALPPDLRLLRLDLSVLESDILIERSLTPLAQIEGSYRAGANLRLSLTCNDEPCAAVGPLLARSDGTADWALREERVVAFPLLADRGRGELRLQLPGSVPLDLLLQGGAGALTLSLHGLQLERLNIELARGDALVSLPLYAPLGTARDEALGTWELAEGDLTLRLPAGLAARFTITAAETLDYPVTHFARESEEGRVSLWAFAAADASAWAHYRLQVPAGVIRWWVADP